MKEPRLYILMRTDMASMTPGRAAAQAAHAQSCFDEFISEYAHSGQRVNQHVIDAVQTWKGNHSFGTVVVLAAEYSQIEVFFSEGFNGYRDRVVDLEYHVRDGNVTHLVPNVVTCVWVFCDKEIGNDSLGHLDLYNGPLCE
jgi:peptidyl-tRNA hydrolase